MPFRIGISIGDPNGIGLEVALRAGEEVRSQNSACPSLDRSETAGEFKVVLIGDRELISSESEKFGIPCPEILDPGCLYPEAHYGETSARAGEASAAWVDAGIDACLNGELDALVTAPINKHAWDLAGIEFPGHTELLADRCGTDRYGMMLMGKGLRVFIATRHVPLREVAQVLGEHDVRLGVELMSEGLPLLGIKDPRIAVCGLNPHAGDGGTLGSEEQEWIDPLVRRLQAEGYGVSGTHPADTVFHQAVKGEYDAVVAMYHDQGLAPLKLLAFDEGVNVTLGLPLIRTSPDHGTAFGIAGKGVARPDSMRHALLAAAELIQQPNPWTPQP